VLEALGGGSVSGKGKKGKERRKVGSERSFFSRQKGGRCIGSRRGKEGGGFRAAGTAGFFFEEDGECEEKGLLPGGGGKKRGERPSSGKRRMAGLGLQFAECGGRVRIRREGGGGGRLSVKVGCGGGGRPWGIGLDARGWGCRREVVGGGGEKVDEVRSGRKGKGPGVRGPEEWR